MTNTKTHTEPAGSTITTATAGGADVLFLGTHGQRNIGDELLLTTFLDQLGSNNHYRINSYDPRGTHAALDGPFDAETFHTTDDRGALVRHLRACDVVVFGGGSIVKELGSTTGRNRHSTLLMLLALVTAVRWIFRKPMLMSNVGVGPITTPTGRFLARLVLRQVTLVSVRDQASHTLASRLGCDDAKLRLVPDAVWANEPTAFDAEMTRRPGSTIRIGLNLNRDIAVPERWHDFVEDLRVAVDAVAANHPVELVGIPMQTGFKRDDDREMLEAFFASLPAVPSTIVEATDHHDIARAVAACDVVVAERLHCLVIAAILGRPAVALSYDPKVDELIAQLGLDRRSVDVNTEFDPNDLASMIEAALADTGESERLARVADTMRGAAAPAFALVRTWIDRRGAGRTWHDLAA